MQQPAPAYCGNEPYVFVCYSHEDKALVYPQIAWLQSQGANVWYDEGISPGEEWSEELGQAINKADRLIFFTTPRSVASRHCRDEVHFAKNHQIPILAVHLEYTVLPAGIELAVGSSQAILAYNQTPNRWHQSLSDVLEINIALPETESQPEEPGSSKLTYGAVAGVILVLGAISWFYLGPDEPKVGSQTLDLSISISSPRVEGDDASLQIVSASLAENLADLLTKYPEIRYVEGSGTSEPLEGTTSYRLAARASSLGDQIGVRLRLLRTSNDQSVWSESYRISTGPSEAALAEIATTVGRFLRFEMARDAQCEVVRQRSRSAEAADLYCLALTQWQRVNRGDAVDIKVAVSAAERAIELDPTIGEAYAIIIVYKIWSSTVFGEMSVQEASRQAHEAAASGLSLEPNNILILYVLAYVEAVLDLNLKEAEATAREGLSIDPFHPYAQELHALLGKIALYRNDVVEALEHYRRAINIFDTDAETFMEYANALRIAGRYAESLEAAQAALKLDHGGPIRTWAVHALASTYVALGEFDKAASAANYVTLADRSDWAGLYAAILAVGGRDAEAQSVWQRHEESGAHIPTLQGVHYSVAIGNYDDAFDWLHRAIDERSQYLLEYLGVDPIFEPLRQDQRWESVMAHLEKAKGTHL